MRDPIHHHATPVARVAAPRAAGSTRPGNAIPSGSRPSRVPSTAPLDCHDSTDPSDCPDSTENLAWKDSDDSIDIDDPMEPSEANDPTDPMEHADPTDPMERTDSDEQIDSSELRERYDQRESMPAIVANSPPVGSPAHGERAGALDLDQEEHPMATFGPADDLDGAEFVNASLHNARFVKSDLSGVVMREVDVQGADIDAPWLSNGDGFLLVNGVDVIPLVEAELDRRFPGRSERRAEEPDALRSAWAALERTWAATLERVAAMPAGTVDVSVAGEWSFAQTLRHLVMATDTWLGRAVLSLEQPYHPLGLANPEAADEGLDLSVFASTEPSYDEVLEARADRVAMVRDFIAGLTPAELATERVNPWAPQYPETTLSCLHTILEEEWEHHRYAVRDLDTLDVRRAGS